MSFGWRWLLVAVVLVAAQAACARITFEIPEYEIPEDNAWDYYLEAFELIRSTDPAVWAAVREDREPWVEDVADLVAEAEPVFHKLREGLGRPCVVVLPGWDSDDPSERSEATVSNPYGTRSRQVARLLRREGWLRRERGDFAAAFRWYVDAIALGQDIPYASRSQQVARLLRWEGWLHRERGDFAAAFRSCLDAIAFGQDIATSQGLAGKLIGMHCEGIGCRGIRRTVAAARDDEGLLAAVVSDLAQVEADEATYAEALVIEYRDALGSLHWYREEMRSDHEWALRFEEEYGSRTPNAYLILTRRTLDRYYSRVVAAAQGEPWKWMPPDMDTPDENTLAYWLIPPDSCTGTVVGHLATLRGTFLVAALELHRARHGTYPESLSDLVPESLAELPLDPWCGEPFRYFRRTADTYTLYSVGEDLKDDGGRDRWAPGVDKAESDLVFSTEK